MLTEMKPIEHFKEMVGSAIRNQKVMANEFVEFYLSNLLAGYITPERLSKEPLATMYFKALESDRTLQGRLLKELGDFSLFISGFFPESLCRSLVDVDYYVSMGMVSYGSLASLLRSDDSPGHLSSLFFELSKRFTLFADVLSEVSERCRLSTSRDVLRVYERWLKTRSKRAEKTLRGLGIEPVSVSTRPVH